MKLDAAVRLRAEMNLRAQEAASRCLRGTPIAQEDVRALVSDCGIDAQEAVFQLLCAQCGLDAYENKADRALEEEYLRPAFALISPQKFKQNAYVQTVQFSEVKRGRWMLTHLCAAPYTLLAQGGLLYLQDGREATPLCCFEQPFAYPAVLENGRMWMSVTPHEVATMEPALHAARGHVMALGLGLGYFAFMASEKPQVHTVTVVEKDENVIAIFKTHLLPQFPHREKVHIVHADALHAVQEAAQTVDFVFADLWHDVRDGLPLYLALKRLEGKLPNAHFAYWLEPEMLAFLRAMAIYDAEQDAPWALHLLGGAKDAGQTALALSDKALERAAATLTWREIEGE